MVDKCNKCKVSSRVPGDSWCVGCSAWESIGRILTSKWEGPQGLKGIADNLVVDCARQVHALRSLGAGHRPASGGPPAGSAAVKEEPRDRSEVGEVKTPGLAAKTKPVPPGEREDYSYTEGEESEESRGGEVPDPRPSLPRHRSAPADPVRKRREEIEEKPREERRERSRDPRGHKQERDCRNVAKEQKRKREHSKERKKDKKEEKSGKAPRRRRGGRKHQRLGRLLEDPYKPHHRKLSEGFLKERPNWADFEGRARGSH